MITLGKLLRTGKQMLYFLRDKISSKTSFSKGELSMILGLYGNGVKNGYWRDYAIDSLPEMAVFSIYKSSQENPAYAIAKKAGRGLLKPSQYEIYSGNKTVKQGSTLSEVLCFFEELK